MTTESQPLSYFRTPLSAHMVGLLLLVSCLYNAGLAVVNAHIFPLNASFVILSEIIIAFAGTCLVIRRFPAIPKMPAAYLLLLVACLSIPIVTFFNESLYLKSIRDVYLIALFFILGSYLTTETLKTYFRALVALILAFMLIEMLTTQIYVFLFEPASYFANTRGVEEFEIDDSGLFRNALGYEGRFSFGIFDTHRLSSLFIEQVSLANFSIVLALFLSTFWKELTKLDRVLYAATIIMIILTTGSRTASVLVVVFAIGYFAFPLLPRYINLLYMLLLLGISAILFYDPSATFDDNVAGRIGHTINKVAGMSFQEIFSGNLSKVFQTGDSGYAYVIYTQTILGLAAFWLFVSLCVPQTDNMTKRFANGLSLYIFVNLLIGAAIFSIKVSAPLWIVAGYLYHKNTRIKHDIGA